MVVCIASVATQGLKFRKKRQRVGKRLLNVFKVKRLIKCSA